MTVGVGAACGSTRSCRVDVSEQAKIARAEGLQVIRVRLGHVAPRVDLAIERHQHALAARLRGAGEPDRIEEVHLGVRAQTVVGTLRSGHYDRLVAVHGQAQEDRRSPRSCWCLAHRPIRRRPAIAALPRLAARACAGPRYEPCSYGLPLSTSTRATLRFREAVRAFARLSGAGCRSGDSATGPSGPCRCSAVPGPIIRWMRGKPPGSAVSECAKSAGQTRRRAVLRDQSGFRAARRSLAAKPADAPPRAPHAIMCETAATC